MNEIIGSFISNESPFGKLMTRLGIIIAANLMFCFFSLPVFTIGAAYTALYHVMFKALRGDGVINPFVQFWKGFRSNFKQATLVWLVMLALIAFGAMDVYWCRQIGGVLLTFQYAIYALGIVLLVIALYLFPTIAAFQDTIPHLIRNSLYFALNKPLNLIVIAFFTVFPQVLTFTDLRMQPLYGFIWVTCGYGLIVLLGATLLLKQFIPYLPKVDACGDFILDEEDEAYWADAAVPEKTELEMLNDLKKLDF